EQMQQLQAMYAAAAKGLDALQPPDALPARVKAEWARLRALTLARGGRHREAAEAAEGLRRVAASNPQGPGHPAGGSALFVAAVGGGPRADSLPPGDAALRGRYLEAALTALRAGLPFSPADAAVLHLEPDYDPLRCEPAYRALLQEVSSRRAAAAK